MKSSRLPLTYSHRIRSGNSGMRFLLSDLNWHGSNLFFSMTTLPGFEREQNQLRVFLVLLSCPTCSCRLSSTLTEVFEFGVKDVKENVACQFFKLSVNRLSVIVRRRWEKWQQNVCISNWIWDGLNDASFRATATDSFAHFFGRESHYSWRHWHWMFYQQ